MHGQPWVTAGSCDCGPRMVEKARDARPPIMTAPGMPAHKLEDITVLP